jgi:hypothetical protein
MVATDKLFAGAAPEIYDCWFPSSSKPMRPTLPADLPGSIGGPWQYRCHAACQQTRLKPE